MQQIADWLESLGLGQYGQLFADNGIDLSVLPDLTDQDLEKLGVVLGHRRKMLRAIGNASGASASTSRESGRDVPAGTFAPPKSYTQTHLAQQVAIARGALEGERKQATVLFCDIANSTALAERIGAEAMHTLLNRFFELALGELHRYECTINQFGGDGFMALAPVAHDPIGLIRTHREQVRDQLAKLFDVRCRRFIVSARRCPVPCRGWRTGRSRRSSNAG